MPSVNDPFDSVQPGPGSLPGEVVEQLGTGQEQDLSHALAVSAEPLFDTVFDGLGARATLVLDANAAASNADYSGPDALINAIAAAGSRLPRAVLYLRPGVYNWTNGSVLAGVTIIGAGSPTNPTAGNYVEIRNTQSSSTGFRFSDGAILKNVLLTTTAGGGNLYLPTGTVGHCTFENVHFKLHGGNLYVQTNRNVFRQCMTHTSATVGTCLQDGGGKNLYEACIFEQVRLTSLVGGSVFSSVMIGQGLLGVIDASSPLLFVGAPANTFNAVTLRHPGALTTNLVRVSSSYNSFSSLVMDGFNTAIEALAVTTATGVNNHFDGVAFLNGSACSAQTNSGLVRLSSSDVVISNLRIVSCTVGTGTGNAALRLEGSSNTVNNLRVASTTGAATIVHYDGTANKLIGAAISSAGRQHGVYFGSETSQCLFTNAVIGNFAVDSNAVAIVHSLGSNNTVTNIEMPAITAIQSGLSMVYCGGTANKISGVRISGAAMAPGSTGHTAFAVVSFQTATSCVVENVVLTSSPGLNNVESALEAGLIAFQGSKGCTLDGLTMSDVGTTSTSLIGSIIYQQGASLNSRCVVRNVRLDGTIRFRGRPLIDIDQARWDGLTLENLRFDVSNPGMLIGIYSSFGTTAPVLPIRVIDSVFLNQEPLSEHFPGAHVVYISGYPRFEFSGCRFTAKAGPALMVEGPASSISSWWGGVFSDCYFQTFGTSKEKTAFCSAGVTFRRCTFAGAISTDSFGFFGAQLFAGWGTAGTGARPTPLVLEDCQMLLERRNFDATGDNAIPQIFLGGVDNTPTPSHGPIVVRGLRIQTTNHTISAWHRAPTLSIDTLNQTDNTVSSYEDIVIDLNGIPFSAPGYRNGAGGPYDFVPICALGSLTDRKHGAVVEINGPTTRTARRTLIKGLKVLRVSRTSGGLETFIALRAIISAQGVILQDVAIDAVSSGGQGNSHGYGSGALQVENCLVENVDLWSTGSIPINVSDDAFVVGMPGLGSHIDAQSSVISRVRSGKVRGTEAMRFIDLLDSTLEQSRLEFDNNVRFYSQLIHAQDGSRVEANVVSCLVHAYHVDDTPVMVAAETIGSYGAPKILNNTFINRATQTANSSFYFTSPSRGGGVRIEIAGDDVEVNGNTILFHFNTGTEAPLPNIRNLGGSRASIVNNHIVNYALSNVPVNPPAQGGGGAAEINLGLGGYHDVVGNVLSADNSNNSNPAKVLINVTGSTNSVVANNRLENRHGTVTAGIVMGDASNKPTPVTSFNTVG